MNSQVEQVDRDAAADFLVEISDLLDHKGIGQIADFVRNGVFDEHEATKSFARHRLASLASQPPVLDEREVIERIIQANRNEQARCDELDHFLDAKECIDVIRETFAAEDTPATTLSPDPVLPGEVREALGYLFDTGNGCNGSPRIIDLCFTAFMAHLKPNAEDGGPSDWFTDTKPSIDRHISEMGRDLLAKLPKLPKLTGEEV